MQPRNAFAHYALRKEAILELLELPSEGSNAGTITLVYDGWHAQVEIALADYAYTRHPFHTPDGRTPPILLGTRAELQGTCSADLDRAQARLDDVLQQVKLSGREHPMLPRAQSSRTRLEQDVEDVLRGLEA